MKKGKYDYISTSTRVGGVEFDSYVLNASGPKDTTLEELKILGTSGSAGIMMKSCTILPREGNPEPRSNHFDYENYGMVQAMGLPNLGYQKYLEFAPKLIKFGKPVIASVVGFSVDEYVTLVKAFQQSTVDLIEVNLSCPNVPGKPQVAYDFEQTEAILRAIENLGRKPIGLKLPPYFDAVHWDMMAKIILRYTISFVSCVNSVGNVLLIDPWNCQTIIKPKGGYAGLSGSSILPISLANVRAFYERLEGKVSIFGVGGVTTGESAFQMLVAGADAVQVGTVFDIDGPGCFSRIDKSLKEFLYYHDFPSAKEAKGKLKFL